MAKFMTIGEPLVVFASSDTDSSLENSIHFQKFLAGAELNVAVGVSRLGHSTEYISQIGKDFIGRYILGELEKEKVGKRYLDLSEEYLTGFYFKESVSKGDPKIEYFRKNSAASNYTTKQLEKIKFHNTELIHVSGIMAGISESSLEAVKKIMKIAQEKKILLTFDPNLRPALWKEKRRMIEIINELAKEATVLLPGLKEGKILTACEHPADIATFYFKQSERTKLVILKDGSNKVFVQERNQAMLEFPSYHIDKVVDTVGAGDGFAVGIITGILEKLSLQDLVQRACAIGALAVQTQGDHTGYPTREELERFIQKNEYEEVRNVE